MSPNVRKNEIQSVDPDDARNCFSKHCEVLFPVPQIQLPKTHNRHNSVYCFNLQYFRNKCQIHLNPVMPLQVVEIYFNKK